VVSNWVSNALSRTRLYRERGQNGVVLSRGFSFYSGKPTIPNSYTGNLLLGASTGGPAAYLLEGVVPLVEEQVCEPIDIELIACEISVNGGDELRVTVTYNLLSDDIYILFNTVTGQRLSPTAVNPDTDTVQAFFNVTSPPADPGPWSFKIMRSSNPGGCFFVQPNCYVIAGNGAT